jgi:hypothetical protein
VLPIPRQTLASPRRLAGGPGSITTAKAAVVRIQVGVVVGFSLVAGVQGEHILVEQLLNFSIVLPRKYVPAIWTVTLGIVYAPSNLTCVRNGVF